MISKPIGERVRRSLTDGVYERLWNDLMWCRLRPGQPINAAELAVRYGVGRTPVREALIRLAHEGYVTVVPRKGYVVAPVRLSDVEHIFQMRLLLEPPAAELAALRRSPAQALEIARLADINERAAQPGAWPGVSGDDRADRLSVNTAFHLAIADAAGNARLYRVVRALLQDVERLYRLGLELDAAERWLRRYNRHHSLADAIDTHDDQRARQLMTEALWTSRSRLMDAIREGVDPTVAPARPVALRDPAED